MVIDQQIYRLGTPKVMGIINVTPDSFAMSCSDMTEDQVLTAASLALLEGADILDIGGCSTRPHAESVSEEEEWRRVELALRVIREAFPKAVLSVDTFRAIVAQRALEQYGVEMINDVSGGSEEMFKVVANARVPYILTHSQELDAGDAVCQVLDYWLHRIMLIQSYGIHDVIVDPGLGFHKTQEQNYSLLARLEQLKEVEKPILVGLSRKSMIYAQFGVQPDSEDALLGTMALHMAALERGVDILRVHDVRAAVEAVRLYACLRAGISLEDNQHRYKTIIH